MECSNPFQLTVTNKYARIQKEREVFVPCGKCLPCLTRRRRDWIFRLEQEHKYSKGALFVTLTYHPKFLPHELKKRHLQLFIKRLRKNAKANNIRYYAVGEYGTKRKRPHYHILLFNASEHVEFIRKSWQFGHIHIGNVSAKSISYCTKYVVQPEQKTDGIQKPFTLMLKLILVLHSFSLLCFPITYRLARNRSAGGTSRKCFCTASLNYYATLHLFRFA